MCKGNNGEIKGRKVFEKCHACDKEACKKRETSDACKVCLACNDAYGVLSPQIVYRYGKEYDTKTCGIVTEYMIRGFAADMVDELNIPIAIFQKIPKACRRFRNEAEREIHRLDVTEKHQIGYNPVCCHLRKNCTNEKDRKKNIKDCEEQDKKVAKYLLKIKGFDCEAFEKEYSITKPQKLKECEHIEYVQYFCERAKLTEVAFLLDFGIGDINGDSLKLVVICGQFLLDDNEKRVKDYIRRAKECMKEDLMNETFNRIKNDDKKKDEYEKKSEEVLNELKRSENTGFLEKMVDVIVGRQLNEKLREILKDEQGLKDALNKIGEKLKILRELIQDLHISRIRANLGSYGRNSVSEEIVGNDNTFDELRKAVQEGVAEKIKTMLGIDEIDCFMTDHPNKQEGSMLTHVDDEKGWVDQRIIELFHKCKHPDDEEKKKKSVAVLINDMGVDKGFLKSVPNYKDYTHVVMPPLGDEFNLVVLIKINETDERWKGSGELARRCRENYFDVIERAVRGAAMVLIHDYNRKIMDDFAVTLRHELGQSNAGFLSNLEHFEEWRAKGRNLNALIDNLLKNAKGYAHGTMLRTNTSRYIKDVTVEHKRFFYPYGAFLYKWASVYYRKMRNSGLYFEFHSLGSEGSHDAKRPKMYAEQEGIEQIAYNLTNNALKYSLPGTKVTLDCRLSDDGKWYQIIVSNYGVAFDNKQECKRVFDRGYQGSNSGIVIEHNDSRNSSVGVGLAISKEIAEAHDGTLELHYSLVSNLCAPYFDRYLELIGTKLGQSFIEKYGLEHLKGKVKSEKERLMRDKKEVWEEMTMTAYLNEHDNPYDVFYAIEKPVAYYKFVLSIPHIREGEE